MEVAAKSRAQMVQRVRLLAGREAFGSSTSVDRSSAGCSVELPKAVKFNFFHARKNGFRLVISVQLSHGQGKRVLRLYRRYALRTRLTVKSCATSKASSSSMRCSATRRAR